MRVLHHTVERFKRGPSEMFGGGWKDTASFRPGYWREGVRVRPHAVECFKRGSSQMFGGAGGRIRLPLGRCSENRYLRVLEGGGEGTALSRLVLKTWF